MLSGVTVSCFLLSYLIVLAAEASRFAVRIPGRNVFLIVMMAAGLFAHTLFVVNQVWPTAEGSVAGQFLSSWFQWTIAGAWGLAIACLILLIRNPNGAIGLFLIPVILGLLAIGLFLQESQPFTAKTTVSIWRILHGVSLLLGTMFICFGFAFGLMYLVQSYRLKSKRRASQRFRLPTLEFLQSMNRLSLFASVISLGIGLLTGIVLSIDQAGRLDWFSGGIIFTFALFVWLLVATLMEISSKSSLGGRRTAYLTLANFAILLLVLGLLLFSQHGQPTSQTTGSLTSQERYMEVAS